jgi:RNA polymerase primary sigma factor
MPPLRKQLPSHSIGSSARVLADKLGRQFQQRCCLFVAESPGWELLSSRQSARISSAKPNLPYLPSRVHTPPQTPPSPQPIHISWAQSPRSGSLAKPTEPKNRPQASPDPRAGEIFCREPHFIESKLQWSANCMVEPNSINTMAYDSDSSLKFYLREISRTPLLTVEEEIELAERIKMGDQAARDHMIRANLRLVVKIAGDYSGYGVSMSDLISEGNIGLMKAVERFDPEKGGKLSTYGAWWIKQSIKRALANQSKTIRLPVHMVDKIARMRRIASLLTEALGREPTDDELATELGLPRQKVAMLKQAALRPTSLDAPVNEGEATEHGDIIGDEAASNPLDILTDKNLHDEIDGLLSILDERERRIIDGRFGLNGIKPMLLEDVGREFGVSRERIRQLQNSALAKMRQALLKKDKPAPKLRDSSYADA